MTAGSLDRRVAVTRKTVTNGPLGSSETWDEVATVWAGRRDVSDGEKAQSGTAISTVAARFVVRSTPDTRDIRPADRLTEGRLTFEIVGIKELGRADWLEITAQARLD